MAKRVVFIPGNGGCTTMDNWFPSVKKELESAGLLVVAETFPDPDLARAKFWLLFLRDQLKIDED